ncbi:MAG: hypothetical protein BMS9Abin25_0591 [Gammaproteobacteria bacterium]|nr:MAG: hypothetical protein BMS9Abin25_0591 [Gammaproteobacteria bacterium]
MVKKIAVLVRDRQGEALRMSLGLSLVDDIIDVYVLDGKLAGTEQDQLNLELMKELEIKIYSNYKKGNESMEYLSTEEIAQKLLEYDHVLPY